MVCNRSSRVWLLWLVVVPDQLDRKEDESAYPCSDASGVRYWTVLDNDLAHFAVADSFLRYARLGLDGAESTTKSYPGSIALYQRWCAGRAGRGRAGSSISGCS